jgi:hypothetical protein
VICPNHNGPMCTTCKLGGLIRCPVLGVPLPLVEGEKPRVDRRRIVYTPSIIKFLREHGHYE